MTELHPYAFLHLKVAHKHFLIAGVRYRGPWAWCECSTDIHMIFIKCWGVRGGGCGECVVVVVVGGGVCVGVSAKLMLFFI